VISKVATYLIHHTSPSLLDQLFSAMDFFKPGSTLKREDPKAHSYEHNRARDAYKKQLDIFKIRVEHELAKHPKMDFDAKQEVRIRAKRLRETCLSNYRESLQGLAKTNFRREYRDTFLGTRETAFEMHDTTILDYELRLATEMDTIISNLHLMKEDKSNRDTLDWMAKLARQKLAYELFEEKEHPEQVAIDLELEPQEEPERTFDYEDDMAGPICLSRRKSPSRFDGTLHLNGHHEDDGEDDHFIREFNQAKCSKIADDYVDEEEYVPKKSTKQRPASPSPVKESLLDVPYCDYIRASHADEHQRHLLDPDDEPFNVGGKVERKTGWGTTYQKREAPRRLPVDVDNEDDVEQFLAQSRALLRKSARSNRPYFSYDTDDEED